jgi:hypothetical protein
VESLDHIDFHLKICPGAGKNCYDVSASSEIAGEASGTLELPFSETELENFVLRIGLTRRATRRIGSPEWKTAQAFGQRLFDAVFTPDVRACFAASRTSAQRRSKILRVKLTLVGGELTNFPWEYLYDRSQGRFLTLYEDTPIVRYIELPLPTRSLTVDPPLRLLVMASSPSDFPPLALESERRNLSQALCDLETKGLLAIEWLEEANLEALRGQLLKQDYHIFHFIGHGGFDEQTRDGVLVLKSASGHGEPVSGERLAVLLGNHRTLRLVILNACEGARTSPVDPFAGAAMTLVRTGLLPAVVAMQFEITDQAAVAFARGFYSALTAGRPVDAAVTQARLAIFAQENDVEWGTPVLYMRSPDGVLFNIQERRNGPLPVIVRFCSGEQAKSVRHWVELADQNWEEAEEHLYGGKLEKWLVQINQEELAQNAEQIRKTESIRSMGLEHFLRFTRLVKRQDKRDIDANIDGIIRQLDYSALRKEKSSKTFRLQIRHKGRGYLNGIVKSNVDWLEIPEPGFGLMHGQSITIELVFVPEKFDYWRPSLKKPIDFSLD